VNTAVRTYGVNLMACSHSVSLKANDRRESELRYNVGWRQHPEREEEYEPDGDRCQHAGKKVEQVRGRRAERQVRDRPAEQREEQRTGRGDDAERPGGSRVFAGIPPGDRGIGRAPEDRGGNHDDEEPDGAASANGQVLLPNGSRLSCGALKKDSFHNLRAPSASSAC